MGGTKGVHNGLINGKNTVTSKRTQVVNKWEEHKGLTSGRGTRG